MKRCRVESGDGERRTMCNLFRGMKYKYMVIEGRRNVVLLAVRALQEFGK